MQCDGMDYAWAYENANRVDLESPGVIHSVTLHFDKMQCNEMDYAWAYENANRVDLDR